MNTRIAVYLLVLSFSSAGCMLIGYDGKSDRDASAGSGGRGEAGAGRGDGGGPAAAGAGGGSGPGDAGQRRDGSGGQGRMDAGDASEGPLADAAEVPEPYCTSSESFCDGDKFVTCDEEGQVVSREDCALVEGHEQQCKQGICHPDRGCELGNAENLSECEDGLFCTVGEHCKDGVCGWGSENTCSSVASACRAGVCNEEASRCDTEPTNLGGPCGTNATCDELGRCLGNAEQCADIEECPISCDSRVSPCALSCAGALYCLATCSAGADCTIDCAGAMQGCQVRCVQGSLCDIDCSAAEFCGPIKCEAGAQCILRCEAQSDTCAFSECVEAEAEWCPDSNAWVCHRPCP